MNRIKPVENQIYHIYNRGVDKRKIFLNERDHLRFIHDLYEFNDKNPALNIYYKSRSVSSYEVGLRKDREKIVDILAFCLMPNHFHLVVKQLEEDGVTEFMRKIGTGYTNYFNQKYEREGSLFQGKYKYVLLESQAHFIHLPYYIHLNPLDLVAPEWRGRKMGDYKKAINFLESYRWSSHLDYSGERNFPSVIQMDFLNEIFDSPEEYKKSIFNWLKELRFESIRDNILEQPS